MEQAIIGVDPHKLSATIEVVDQHEKLLGSGRFTTDRAGYAAMRKYAGTWPVRLWARGGGECAVTAYDLGLAWTTRLPAPAWSAPWCTRPVGRPASGHSSCRGPRCNGAATSARCLLLRNAGVGPAHECRGSGPDGEYVEVQIEVPAHHSLATGDAEGVAVEALGECVQAYSTRFGRRLVQQDVDGHGRTVRGDGATQLPATTDLLQRADRKVISG